MLHIDNVTYRHKKETPLYHYTLCVSPASVVAVMGESGSGKSTLLDLIAGFLQPLSGSIILNGEEITHKRVDQRGVSILFQHHNLFEHLSVRQNLQLARKGVGDDEIAHILQEVGLEGYEQKSAASLSGGEAQRVALARILLRRAPVLLLDEPFSGLDTQTHQAMLALVARMTKEHNLHTVMVTHDALDASTIADVTYRMHDYHLSLQ